MAVKWNILLSLATRGVVIVAVLTVAVVVYLALYHTRPRASVSDRVAPSVAVVALPLERVPVRRQFAGYGTVRPMDASNVPARVSATVIEIPEGIEDGAAVQAGELLVRLDDYDFQRQVEITTETIEELAAQVARLDVEEASWRRRAELAAEAVTLAEAEYERVENALRQTAAKPRELDLQRQAVIAAVRDEVGAREELDKIEPRRRQLQAQKAAQEAALRLARENVKRCRIVSPLDGVIQSVDVEVGENLQVGQRVARVVNVDRVEIPLQLPASARAVVEVGDEAEIRGTGPAAPTWRAVVTRIAPETDERTRTVAAYVVVEGDEAIRRELAPGSFVSGTVTAGVETPRWIVPRRALAGERLLFVRDGVVVAEPVEVDFNIEGRFPRFGIDDRQWVVLAGEHRAGDLVVVNAARNLAEGARVQAVRASGDAIAAGEPGGGPGPAEGTP